MFKKSATYICILLSGIVGIFGVNITNYGTIEWGVINTYAAQCGDKDFVWPCQEQDANMQKMLQSLVGGLNIILDLFTIIVTPAIILASWLMSPDWTSGDLFQIRPMIHELWIVVSNVTYFIYAILLIFIAMATIFNSDKYGYKQLLPKLALGIIMVPLSWWFIQFIISLSTLVTASVISIPSEVVINYNKTNAASWWTTPSIPTETIFDSNKKTPAKSCAEQACISPENFIQKSWGMYSSLMIYSFAVFKFQDVKVLNGTTDTVKSIWQIINQWLIGAIMFVVYGLLVLALIFMLMIRAIKLWFYAIFSPFMTLKFVLWESMFKDKNDSFEIKEFIGLAFVPAIVGLALSFGLIIVSVMLKPAANVTKDCNDTKCTLVLFWNTENTIVTQVKDVDGKKKTETKATIGGASYTFLGDVTSWNTTGNVMSALNQAWGIIGTIIIDIIALVFIWVAFMAAKGVSKVAAAAFAPFEDIGNKMGSLAASIPKYTPIPFTGGMSVSSGAKVFQNAENALTSNSEDKFKWSAAGKLFGWDKVVNTVDEKQFKDRLDNVRWTNPTDPGLEAAWKIIEKQAGKNIEYSSLFKDLAWKLKDFTNPNDKIKALETAGYTNENARKIVDQLAKHNDEVDKNDATLMTALKSRIWTPGGKWWTNSGWNTLASATFNDKDKTMTISGNVILTDASTVKSDSLIEKLAWILKNDSEVTIEKLTEKLKTIRPADAETIAKWTIEKIKTIKESEVKKSSTPPPAGWTTGSTPS